MPELARPLVISGKYAHHLAGCKPSHTGVLGRLYSTCVYDRPVFLACSVFAGDDGAYLPERPLMPRRLIDYKRISIE